MILKRSRVVWKILFEFEISHEKQFQEISYCRSEMVQSFARLMTGDQFECRFWSPLAQCDSVVGIAQCSSVHSQSPIFVVLPAGNQTFSILEQRGTGGNAKHRYESNGNTAMGGFFFVTEISCPFVQERVLQVRRFRLHLVIVSVFANVAVQPVRTGRSVRQTVFRCRERHTQSLPHHQHDGEGFGFEGSVLHCNGSARFYRASRPLG